MKSKKTVLLMWALALLPVVMLALAWSRLPEQVPIHWNVHNQVDRWASPAALWGLCAVGPVVALLFQFLPRLDPKRENYEKFQSKYELVAVSTLLLLAVVMAVTLAETLWPGRLNVGKVICLVMGVLFLVLGNLMGKVKPNWFLGFRTPWALSDPDVWNKTQRLAGWVLFLSGCLLIPLTLLAPPEVTVAVLLALLLGGTLLTYYKSWKWFKEKGSEESL